MSAAPITPEVSIPGLTWDEYRWEGTIALPTWEAFNQGTGPWKAIRAATLARRRRRERAAGQQRHELPYPTQALRLSVTPPAKEHRLPPTTAQVRAYQHLLTHDGELLTATLAALHREWTAIWLIYDYPDEYAIRHSLPAKLRAPEELCGLLRLHTVYLSDDAAHGLTHIGLALSCAWDPEHGLGIYAHGNRVLGIGSGDLAFGDLDDAFIRCESA